MADVNDSNRLENLVGEDVDPKWNEPSTRGDLRLLAIRIDTKFDQVRSDFHTFKTGIDSKFEQFGSKFEQLEGKFNLHANGIDSKFEQSRSDIRVLVAETNAKVDSALAEFARTMYRGGMIFAGAIISANLAMLSIFATLIR